MKHIAGEANHPTQGLQYMTLDLSTYSDDGLKELQTRIEAEKTKRERKVPFHIDYYDPKNLSLTSENCSVILNLRHRLTAEAKIRAAGGGAWKPERKHFLKSTSIGLNQIDASYAPIQGTVFFENAVLAANALATLTPDEQAAIFGFGEG